jgi:hypothetical protein
MQAPADVTRPMVKGLFAATCLLSIVSWYTTEQGMALYLSPWFAVLASLGVQGALVLVAWLIGLNRSKRTLLGLVYAITATVSIAFSYVSLYTWFSARERPAAVERKLYDELNNSLGKTQQLVAAASAEAQKHVLALEEMGRPRNLWGLFRVRRMPILIYAGCATRWRRRRRLIRRIIRKDRARGSATTRSTAIRSLRGNRLSGCETRRIRLRNFGTG